MSRVFGINRCPVAPGRWTGMASVLAAAPHLTPARLGWAEGGVSRMRVLGRRFAAVTDPAVARHILQSDNFRRSFHYETYRIILGRGLFTNDGPEWARRRRIMLPAFRTEQVNSYGSTIRACVESMLQRWQEAANRGVPVDAVAEAHRLTIDVIGRTLLSLELSATEADRLAETLVECLVLVRRRNTAVARLPLWIPSADNLRLRRIRAELDGFIAPHVDARLARPNPRSSSQGQDMLDDLISARHPGDGSSLSRDMLVEETKTLFITGYETTAVTLSWILFLLAASPDAAAPWHQECDRLVDRPGEADTATPLRADDAPYIGAVINEGMRLFPAAYNVARVCVADETVDGHPFRRNETALISIFGMHRSQDIWGDPDVFRPDRFLVPECPVAAFMPFASGKHLCIGAGFAQAEITTALAMIGRRFTVRLADDGEVGMAARVTLAPDRPIPLILTPRP